LTEAWFWGESAFPFFLNVVLLYEQIGHHKKAKKLLVDLLVTLLRSNSRMNTQNIPLSDPYYGVHEILESLFGFQEENIDFTIFSGSSYILKPIISMMARRKMRFELEKLWRPITHIHIYRFLIDQIEDFFSWRTKLGDNTGQFPLHKQSWTQLKNASFGEMESRSELVNFKNFFNLFLMVYPHRADCQAIALLESEKMRTQHFN